MLGQWCNQTTPAWSFSDEAADFLLGVYMAMNSDWDGVVRRGVFLYPQVWGEGPAGTVGGEDLFQIAEALNGSPHLFASVAARRFALSPRPRRARRNQGPLSRSRGQGLGQRTPPARRRMGSCPRPALFRHAVHARRSRLVPWRDRFLPAARALDREPVRRAGGHLDQQRADRLDQAACSSRRSPGFSRPIFAG